MPATPTLEKISKLAEQLPPTEQRQLITRLVININRQTRSSPGITAAAPDKYYGTGKNLWTGDATQYVRTLREDRSL
ncbi:hypothetical protein AUK40_02475 [Candidatus Wirthbacteria bacterium CG2_30_54_11]|uniref:DUF2281 domain-containing protein n=1 Tax=Candidatus Wirthbacteria bacterium CG2_30_54_11 TaxID=1817892 RepID=A0A1J5IL38_9BACT|nr:MAG: hypothetical protein AUK40_02475 [Candidatus Wirthbacteria bacterium CG2_30_54_11]